MKMNYYKARNFIRHVDQLCRLFPRAPLAQEPDRLWAALRRLEARTNRAATRDCNGEKVPQDWDEKALASLRGILGPSRVKLEINREPRGYALKVSGEWRRKHAPGLWSDMGGDGVLVPEFGK